MQQDLLDELDFFPFPYRLLNFTDKLEKGPGNHIREVREKLRLKKAMRNDILKIVANLKQNRIRLPPAIDLVHRLKQDSLEAEEMMEKL